MWYFKPVEPGIPERNPRETEFFKLTSPSESVVREFIQNALDAKRNQEIIKVKISFCQKERDAITSFLDDTLKQHLVACKFLSDGGYPENIHYIILEDFGTTGLDGSFTPEAGSGNFYDFWWREGISEKMGQRGGRWGLGKITFHLVSKIRTFWGLTTRNDGKTLLMGKSLLKTHIVNNGRYHYFGYFSSECSMPVKDSSMVTRFKNIFGISRNNTETGLSIVIPMPVDEIDYNTVLKAAIQHYFYPLLTGALKIEISEDNRAEEINNDNLVERASVLDWDNTEWEGKNIREILEFVKSAINQCPIILQIENPKDPEITSVSFGAHLQDRKTSFRAGVPLKFQFPVKIIRKSDGTEQDSFLTVFLQRFPEIKTPFECYIRSGILISEIRMMGKRPVASLLLAEDQPVCEFLGDCETPAHTNWNERSEGFAEKYENAARILRFIRKSAAQIISVLDEPPRGRQVDFLKEIFSVPVIPEEREEEKEDITRKPVIPPVVRKPEVFNVSMIQNGFSVTLNPQRINIQFPYRAIIKMAYDTRRGNPLAQYEKFDFDAGSGSMNITCQDCNILSRSLNKIGIEVKGQNFRLEVTGFDPTRDIIVYVKGEI